MAEDRDFLNEVPVTHGTTTQEEVSLIDNSEEENYDRFYSFKMLFVLLLLALVGGGCGLGVWLLVVGGDGGLTPDDPFQLVTRSAWGAKNPKNITYYPNPPPKFAVIIHTDTLQCSNQDMCSSELRDIQKNQMRTFDDIAYNFLVGGDGRTYEGRGWDVQGAFAEHYNNVSLGIAFIGKFETVLPPEKQLKEAKVLLSVSVARKKLASDYVLLGHRELTDTESPGSSLYNTIKTWPHWKNCYKESCFQHHN